MKMMAVGAVGNRVVMTFVWMSRLPSIRMFSLSATKATPALARASRMVTI